MNADSPMSHRWEYKWISVARAAKTAGDWTIWSENDNPLPTPVAMIKYGERWRPYRTVASWYLWRALELPPPSRKRERKRKSK